MDIFGGYGQEEKLTKAWRRIASNSAGSLVPI